MSEEKWVLTEEHKKQIPEWNERWIKLIMSCEEIDADKTTEAVLGMCKAAALPVPRVVYAPSPFVGLALLATAASIDETLTSRSKHPLVKEIMKAKSDELCVANKWTDGEFGNTPQEVMAECKRVIKPLNPNREEFNRILSNWSSYYNGGSEWASWASYLSFVRDVIGWKHPSHENYRYYENACLYGGPRFMARHAVIICDRALRREINDNRQPHNETGPSLEWRCGAKLWHIDGVEVDEQIVLRPETQTITQIEKESNAEVRRVRIDRYGWVRYLEESGAKIVDTRRNDRDSQQETLYKLKGGEKRFVCIDPSTGRKYALGCPRDVETCQAAQNYFSFNLDEVAIHRS